jgi:hypothetical protein
MPGRPAGLSVRRLGKKGGVVVSWLRARKAWRYGVSMVLANGDRRVATHSARCESAYFPKINKTQGLWVEVSGVRRDMKLGPAIGLRLKPRQHKMGAGGVVRDPVC